MGLLDFLNRRREIPSQITESAEGTKTFEMAAPELVLAPVVSPVLLKRLKWVVCSQGVGIVWDFDTSGYAVVHLTDAEGQTIAQVRVRASELRLAKYLEIPKPRRPQSQVYAATLGYM